MRSFMKSISQRLIELDSGLRDEMRSQFSSVQSLSRVRLFATLWTAACQASLSITNSRSLGLAMQIYDSSSPAPLEQLGGERGWILSLLCSPASCPLPDLPGCQLCSNLSFKRITHDLFCSDWIPSYLTVKTLTQTSFSFMPNSIVLGCWPDPLPGF